MRINHVCKTKLKKKISLLFPKYFVIEKSKFTKMYMHLNSTWITAKIGHMHYDAMCIGGHVLDVE